MINFLDNEVYTDLTCAIVINEDVYLELLELLELYCELLIARFGLLDQKYVQGEHPLKIYN